MVKRCVILAKTPTLQERRALQRGAAEWDNVREVAFDGNRMILHLISQVPEEQLLTQLPLPESVDVQKVE